MMNLTSLESLQLRYDFGFTPTLVDEYVKHTPREDALRGARQVTGAGTYLSKMATGEARMFENAIYAVTIVCIDEVSDELGDDLYPEAIENAIEGRPDHESLEIVPHALSVARDERAKKCLRSLAMWQDKSRRQEQDIGIHEIEQITASKGGWSAKGHLHMMKEGASDEEVAFADSFGFLMQLLDDHLDKLDDRREGVSTMFTDGMFTEEMLDRRIDDIEERAEELYGEDQVPSRFFHICRLHKEIGGIRNHSGWDPSRLLPWYL